MGEYGEMNRALNANAAGHHMGSDAIDDGRMGGGRVDMRRGLGTMAATAETPPVMQIVQRISQALSHFESRCTDVVQAGHRTADRIIGEEGPSVAAQRGDRPGPAPMGYGGQYAELEAIAMRLERELEEHGSQLERMINRVTRLG